MYIRNDQNDAKKAQEFGWERLGYTSLNDMHLTLSTTSYNFQFNLCLKIGTTYFHT